MNVCMYACHLPKSSVSSNHRKGSNLTFLLFGPRKRLSAIAWGHIVSLMGGAIPFYLFYDQSSITDRGILYFVTVCHPLLRVNVLPLKCEVSYYIYFTEVCYIAVTVI